MDYELTNHASRRIHDRKIDRRWLEAAISDPDRLEQDPIDSTALHALKRIGEKDDRVLRVVYNSTAKPVRIISVYFDRRLKGQL